MEGRAEIQAVRVTAFVLELLCPRRSGKPLIYTRVTDPMQLVCCASHLQTGKMTGGGG